MLTDVRYVKFGPSFLLRKLTGVELFALVLFGVLVWDAGVARARGAVRCEQVFYGPSLQFRDSADIRTLDDREFLKILMPLKLGKDLPFSEYLRQTEDNHRLGTSRMEIRMKALGFLAGELPHLKRRIPKTFEQLDLGFILRLGIMIDRTSPEFVEQVSTVFRLNRAQRNLLLGLFQDSILFKYSSRSFGDEVVKFDLAKRATSAELPFGEFLEVFASFTLASHGARPDRAVQVQRSQDGELSIIGERYSKLMNTLRTEATKAGDRPAERSKDGFSLHFKSHQDVENYVFASRYLSNLLRSIGSLKVLGIDEVGDESVTLKTSPTKLIRLARVFAENPTVDKRIQIQNHLLQGWVRLLAKLSDGNSKSIMATRPINVGGSFEFPQVALFVRNQDRKLLRILIVPGSILYDSTAREFLITEMNVKEVDSFTISDLSGYQISAETVPGFENLSIAHKVDVGRFSEALAISSDIKSNRGLRAVYFNQFFDIAFEDLGGFVVDEAGNLVQQIESNFKYTLTQDQAELRELARGGPPRLATIVSSLVEDPSRFSYPNWSSEFRQGYNLAVRVNLSNLALPNYKAPKKRPVVDWVPFAQFIYTAQLTGSGSKVPSAKESAKGIEESELLTKKNWTLSDLPRSQFAEDKKVLASEENISQVLVPGISSHLNADELEVFRVQAIQNILSESVIESTRKSIEELGQEWSDLNQMDPEIAKKFVQIYLGVTKYRKSPIIEVIKYLRTQIKNLKSSRILQPQYRITEIVSRDENRRSLDKDLFGVDIETLQRNYDLLARQTYAGDGLVNEVEIAFQSSQRGIPNTQIQISDGIIQGADRDTLGQKVFAIGVNGAIGFKRKMNESRISLGGTDRVRYFAILMPAGFIAKYGEYQHEERIKTTRVKVKTEDGFKTKTNKLFAINYEKSTRDDGQVHFEFAGTIKLPDGTEIPMLDFLRQHVIAVLEFDESGKILRIKKF